MSTKPKYPNLLEGIPDWSRLTPEEQWERIAADRGFQQLLDSGDQDAQLAFDQMSRKLVEWRESEQAKEVEAAKAAHEQFMKNPGMPIEEVGPKADLKRLLADPKFVEAYEKGDAAARRDFEEKTAALAGIPEHRQVI